MLWNIRQYIYLPLLLVCISSLGLVCPVTAQEKAMSKSERDHLFRQSSPVESAMAHKSIIWRLKPKGQAMRALHPSQCRHLSFAPLF